MKITYNLKYLYEDRYIATWEQPMGDGTKTTQVATFRTTEFSLQKFLNLAQQRISGQVASLRKTHPSVPRATGSYRVYEWDRDASALPECYKRQLEKQQQTFKMVDFPAAQADAAKEEKPREPELYEIAKQNGVWTIKKHESELMTWEEACNELAKRIA